MAAVTFTASELTSAIKSMPTGIVTKTSRYTLSVAASASSIFFLCRVPDKALILDFQFFCDDAGGSSTANQVTAQTWQIGISQPEGSASQTTTKSAIAPAQAIALGGSVLRGFGVNLPYQVSISSECLQRWAWITASPSLNPSSSAVIRFTVKYTMDGA